MPDAWCAHRNAMPNHDLRVCMARRERRRNSETTPELGRAYVQQQGMGPQTAVVSCPRSASLASAGPGVPTGAGTATDALRRSTSNDCLVRAYPGVMTLTVHLPGEVAAALEAEAVRRGQTPAQVAANLIAEQLPQPGTRRTLAFAAVGSSTSGHSAAEADDMLAEGFGRD
jgi:hypothetical protein